MMTSMHPSMMGAPMMAAPVGSWGQPTLYVSVPQQYPPMQAQYQQQYPPMQAQYQQQYPQQQYPPQQQYQQREAPAERAVAPAPAPAPAAAAAPSKGTVGVIGSTGATGSHFIALALAAGWKVKALARDVSKIKTVSPNLEAVQGGLTEQSFNMLCPGCDYVFMAIMDKKGHFTKSTALPALMAAMKANDVKHFVYQAGAFSPTPDTPLTGSLKCMRCCFGPLLGLSGELADNDRAINILYDPKFSGGVPWTVTLLGMVKEMPSKGTIVASPKAAGGTVGFKDLAAFSLRILGDSSLFRKSVYPDYAKK